MKRSNMQQIQNRLSDLRHLIKDAQGDVISKFHCSLCLFLVNYFQNLHQRKPNNENAIRELTFMCTLAQIQTAQVCAGVIAAYVPDVFYILEHTKLNSNEICSFLLSKNCGKQSSMHEWDIGILPGQKPAVKSLPIVQENAPKLKVLQLSDTHYDPLYKQNSIADCNEPLCCHAESARKFMGPLKLAGQWGEYMCDTPLQTLENMLQHIQLTHPDIDFIYWTGDLPAHDLWIQTKQSNLQILNDTVQLVLKYFPNTKIFPALGNHETAPANLFPTPNFETENITNSWLYNTLDTQWKKLMGSEVYSSYIKGGGFYSILVKSDLKIISLNMNYCHYVNL